VIGLSIYELDFEFDFHEKSRRSQLFLQIPIPVESRILSFLRENVASVINEKYLSISPEPVGILNIIMNIIHEKENILKR
jgi:hypothetical protein